MHPTTYALIAVLAYLLGSIPFGYLLVRFFRKEDIRDSGSGNIGATNVIRSGAKGLGALTFLLDALKGWAAVFLGIAWAHHLGGSPIEMENAIGLAALFAILGHIYPVWLRFHGGKGVATAFGVFIALVPVAALLSLGIFVVVFALSRYVSLASIVAAIAFPVLALAWKHAAAGPVLVAVIIGIPLLVIAKHHANIARLVSGTEHRFGKAKPV